LEKASTGSSSVTGCLKKSSSSSLSSRSSTRSSCSSSASSKTSQIGPVASAPVEELVPGPIMPEPSVGEPEPVHDPKPDHNDPSGLIFNPAGRW